jgi:hypothetical protein
VRVFSVFLTSITYCFLCVLIKAAGIILKPLRFRTACIQLKIVTFLPEFIRSFQESEMTDAFKGDKPRRCGMSTA